MRLNEKLLLLVVSSSVCITINAQSFKNQVIRNLTVADGLPQSVVMGVVQDSVGFIWISTRDGLARYDGRKYKIFRHIPGDSTSLSNNIIAELYMGNNNRLWIKYETGDIDIINTLTESVIHLTVQKKFHALFKALKVGHTVTEDDKGNAWLLGINGLFFCNPQKQQLNFYAYASLKLSGENASSITYNNKSLVVITNLSLTRFNDDMQVIEKIKYPTSSNSVINTGSTFKNYYAVFRKNGDAIIQSQNQILVYKTADKSFLAIPLPFTYISVANSMVTDNMDNAYLFYGTDIYYLSANNKLSLWKPKEQTHILLTMLFDRSGVLWIGSDGGGVELFDLRLSHLQGIAYKLNFPKDIFNDYLNVNTQTNAAFSTLNNPYTFRWTNESNGTVIFTGTDYDSTKTPQLFFYKNNQVVIPSWHYNDTTAANHKPVFALATSSSGKIWGINFFMQPVYFDAAINTVTVYNAITNADEDGIGSTDLLMDGEDKFWITTAFEGLYFYNKQSGKTIHYTYSEKPGALPTNQLIHIEQDAANDSLLWISSLGAGIIKFNKATGKCIFFTTRDGLPDNTVYAMVPDKNNIFWCSSNKGIFSFNPKNNKVLQTFTSKDGLAGDEFNRFHFFKFRNGDIAFGGVNGYTVFNPFTVQKDLYQPTVGLTGIEINNAPADFGQPSSPFKTAVNSLAEIRLPYDQNFIIFQFAALEYNIPDKIKYRYILKNFDKDWVFAGNSNIATYTKLPPGNYTFAVNATNTSGKWSSYIKSVVVIINPPFWLTWWFISLIALVIALLIYIFIRYRIQIIRKEERQKIAFEQQASALKTQALRAQMNPHFIFNCLNSIKSLIHENNKREAIIYLTTFSKLIRSQLNNVEQEITLHDELETCKIYTELESLRFGVNIVCEFMVDERVDMLSFCVPPLIIQPFIENAIWHGVLPNEGGKILISVLYVDDNTVKCTVDDDGIGREVSMLNKLSQSVTYESKGMKLVKNRLNLYNIIHNNGGNVEVIDKKNTKGNATGTLVIITFKK